VTSVRLLVLAGLCLVSPIHALDGFAFSRDLDIPAAGWVRVPLDMAAIRHMAPGGADLHVLAPGGQSIPFRLSAAPPESSPGLTIATRGAPCRLGPSSSICTLDIPAGQVMRRLTLEIEGAGPIGFRLLSPVESRWELLAEGVWQAGGVLTLPGGTEPVEGSTLRLELHGPGGPRVRAYALDLAEPTVTFQAPGPGRYLLAYGGIGGGPSEAAGAADALWLEPGPEQPGEPPRLPTGPAAQLDAVRFSNAWEVSVPEAEPGDLVRLELSSVVYGAAREDLGDLRLSAGGRQIPYFRWSPPEPAFAAGDPGLQPSESERPGESRAVVSLPSEGLPLTQLHLSAMAVPLRRPVTVLYGEETATRSTWECVPAPPLPCRTRIDLPGTAPRLLTVLLRDGDNPRLSALGVSVWRRRDVLLFVWPELEPEQEETGSVRLLAGAESLEAPRYDLASLGPALLGHPWQTAELRRAGAVPEKPWWGRWVMPLGVTIVAVWLVWLLRRILTEA
jgi:hypothetical protein